MDGVASAFAVVSLAIQLVETGEKISKFLTSVQDAPIEVTKLGQTLDQLNSTLQQVSYLLEQQYLVQRLPGSPVFITKALENCERRINTLEGYVQKAKVTMDHGNRVHRSWAAMRFISKRDDVRELQSQLRDAEAGLQTAILSNSWQLQMHLISVSKPATWQAITVEQPTSLVAPSDSVIQREEVQSPSPTTMEVFRTTSKATDLLRYRGFLGSVNIQIKSKSLSRLNARRPRYQAISEEKVVQITPIFLRKTVELRFLNSFGQISRTLNMYPILEYEAPIFRFCREGDLQGLQVALSSGTVSPFALDEDGWSLLHYAVLFKQAEMCKFLLRLGVDPNRVDTFGRKAMISAGQVTSNDYEYIERTIDILRLFIQSQDEISSRDSFNIWLYFSGPVEAAEYIYNQSLFQPEPDVSAAEGTPPFLATALRHYGRRPLKWEAFIRRLLRKGVDLHSPMPRLGKVEGSVYPCKILEYGTPLDELFWYTVTPFEGEAAADGWLQALASEGYDITAYLEEELALHAPQMQFTHPYISRGTYQIPHQLVYRWGTKPSISWDWWIDPDSSTYLVRETFKHMNIMRKLGGWYDWDELWPLRYPAWSKSHGIRDDDWQLRYDRAQERANRRLMKKAMKAARAQGLKKRTRMPGAWPT